MVRSEIEARREVLVWEADMWRTLAFDAGKAKKAGSRLVKSVSVRKRTLCISSNTPSSPLGQVQCQRCKNELKTLVVNQSQLHGSMQLANVFGVHYSIHVRRSKPFFQQMLSMTVVIYFIEDPIRSKYLKCSSRDEPTPQFPSPN